MGRYSAQKWGGGGVSRGLGCTYLKGITIHEESEGEGKNDVLVECEVVGGLGKRNVVLRAWTPNKYTQTFLPQPSQKKKSFKPFLSSIFPISTPTCLYSTAKLPKYNTPNHQIKFRFRPYTENKNKKKLTFHPTTPGTMKRRTGEVLAICEHSKVNIVGVELPGSASGSEEKEKEKKEGKGKESKL
ncbi:hypothetical protein BELL_2214g00010 [Botrytis elliptica]|uniref:Uncharacterized protein n=1 Tax=Botrytis elliptica TaxID=278938 RepID=A0A4Z1HAX3_9HELO|nr:hypothetical protein BELL_2214g00010 [Botrytis elliptica]